VDGGLPPDSSTGTFTQDDLLDEIMDSDGRASISVRKTMAPDSPWYPDHFPRFPVTPIVILNEVIAAASSRLLRTRHGADAVRVAARGASGIKIKSFVRPGETCDVTVSVISESPQGDNVLVETVAELARDGKKLLRGHYSWEVVRG
jgi:3-hydroxymyristoyl/3-hydroxydecanoyl-(acyl carrier protein) dehydratase